MLSNEMTVGAWTDPESTFVASACECGVAVQGDGLQLPAHSVQVIAN